MILITNYNYLKTINLYCQTINALTYINDCYTLEQLENQNIITYISEWLLLLKTDLESDLIKIHKLNNSSEPINDKLLAKEINQKYDMFNTIVENFRFVPLQPPFFTLRAMVEEAEKKNIIPNPSKISNIYFKNIPQFEFTEKRMGEPEYHSQKPDNKKEKIKNKVGGTIPHVLSMTVIYQYNPLMWPLLFHEYGHFVFKNNHMKNDIQECIDKILTEKKKLNSDVSDDIIKACINEVYCDLYAINCYSTNYFLAFFFCQMIDDSNFDKITNYDFSKPHPPSHVRIDYMIKELKKRGFLKDNDAVKSIIQQQNSFIIENTDKIDTYYKKYQLLFNFIYDNVSLLFDGYQKYNFKKPEIEELVQCLKNKMPIGTVCKNRENLKEILQTRDKKFNVDSDNNIIDIIQTGWRFFILHLCEKLYSDRNYLVFSSDDDHETFYKDYTFFIKNLNYSIETSVIVSSYLGDDHV